MALFSYLSPLCNVYLLYILVLHVESWGSFFPRKPPNSLIYIPCPHSNRHTQIGGWIDNLCLEAKCLRMTSDAWCQEDDALLNLIFERLFAKKKRYIKILLFLVRNSIEKAHQTFYGTDHQILRARKKGEYFLISFKKVPPGKH